MPKMKTHQGMKKRVKVSKRGKMKHRRTGQNHLLEKKQKQQKRNKQAAIDNSDKKNVKQMLGK